MTPLAPKPTITLITPVFNESAALPRYMETVRRVLLSVEDIEWQILFVDDGSQDDSWEQIASFGRTDPRVQALRLSRNFGAHAAVGAGLDLCSGDAAAVLSADLQDPAETVLEFIAEWRRGAKIVWGFRRTRQDSFWKRLTSGMYYQLIARYALPKGSKFRVGGFFLADKIVVECMRRFEEHNKVIGPLVAYTGFSQAVVPYDRQHRELGQSGWRLSVMLKTMYDVLLGFSDAPVRWATRLGFVTSLLSVGLACYLLINWWIGDPLPGYTSVMVALAFFFGLQFLLMGLWGQYLYRILSESVHRPRYFVSETVNRK